jgi:hypothetical protein
MEGKKKLASDLRIIISEGILGAVVAAFILVFKPRPGFARGLIAGFCGAVIVLAVIAFLRRVKGYRKLGEMDEREVATEGKAASVALALAIIGLAFFVMLAYSIPALMALNPALVAVTALAGISLVYGIAFVILNRR